MSGGGIDPIRHLVQTDWGGGSPKVPQNPSLVDSQGSAGQKLVTLVMPLLNWGSPLLTGGQLPSKSDQSFQLWEPQSVTASGEAHSGAVGGAAVADQDGAHPRGWLGDASHLGVRAAPRAGGQVGAGGNRPGWG